MRNSLSPRQISTAVFCAILAIATPLRGQAAVATFEIKLVRDSVREVVDDGVRRRLVYGTIAVNDTIIGTFYENDDVKIAAGRYHARLRYVFDTASAGLGPLGAVAKTGDFGVEILGVPNNNGGFRYGILFHGGSRPHHSKGCILLGPTSPGPNGTKRIGDGRVVFDGATGTTRYVNQNPFVVMRQMFYGTDNPTSTPNKDVWVTIGPRS